MRDEIKKLKQIPSVDFSKAKEPELEFEVLILSDLIKKVKNIEIIRKPHRLNFYNVLHIVSGKGEHTIDFQNYKYKEGDTLLIGKGQVHAFQNIEKVKGILIVFTERFLFKNLVKSDYLSIFSLGYYNNFNPLIRPEKKSKRDLLADAESIYKEYNSENLIGKEQLMQCLLKIFLIRLERCRTSPKTEQMNPLYAERFQNFIRLLEDHCTSIREAETYSRMLSVSYKHMNNICLQASGISMKKMIDRNTALEMKRQIALTGISINELTKIFNFDEPTNLVKFFAKNTGITPARFRKSLSS